MVEKVYFDNNIESKTVVVHIPTTKAFDTDEVNNLKDRLTLFKRAQKLLKEEIKRVEEQLIQSEIKASGQIDIETAIDEARKEIVAVKTLTHNEIWKEKTKY